MRRLPVDLAADCFIDAAPAVVAPRVTEAAFWRTVWPDLFLTEYHDRGSEGRRWYVGGTLVGTAEVWLEPCRGGTIVHTYLRAEPAPAARSIPPAARRERELKRAFFALKDELEAADP